MSYKQDLDKMVWSFSRIHLWEQCPYAFYLQYIEGVKGIDNFWAENGKAVHLTLEKFFKDELTLEEMPHFYIERFDNICNYASQNSMTNTFNVCIDFLCEFDFSFFDDYEILGVEKECRFTIGKYPFRGIIDLLLRNKHTNEIIVFDHKSSPYPFKKDGKSVLKNCQENFESYKHQMYLYCKQVIEEYGEEPEQITWLHFKDSKLATIPFNRDEYNETLKWVENTIKKIYRDKRFLPNQSFMMCGRLCDFREGDCDYKDMKEE